VKATGIAVAHFGQAIVAPRIGKSDTSASKPLQGVGAVC
jgi:hypothetical protein